MNNNKLVIDDAPLYLISIANDLQRLNSLVEDKDAVIKELQKQVIHLQNEIEIKEEQMNRLIHKNAELSLRIISKQNKYQGYMTLD